MKCSNCKYWERLPDTKYQFKMGKCSKLSAQDGKDYPDENNTGIVGTPICYHDGGISQVETKEWFGCVHFSP